MRFLRIRLMETLGTEIILSVICSVLFYLGILEQTIRTCSLVMFLCAVLNIVRLVVDLKRYCRHSRTGKRGYYKTNLTVVGVVAVLSLTLSGFNAEPLFTWLFFPFKLLYIRFGVPKLVSALVLNVVYVVVTVCMPIFIKLPKKI